MHGEEERAWGDAGYQGVHKRPEFSDSKVQWHIALRPGKRSQLDEGSLENRIERVKASVRAKVEHPFLIIKRTFGYNKVRYRGLAKNESKKQAVASIFGSSLLKRKN